MGAVGDIEIEMLFRLQIVSSAWCGLGCQCARIFGLIDDIAGEKKRMEAMGFPEVYGFTVGLGTFAYFDTRKVGNLMIELLQPPPA